VQRQLLFEAVHKKESPIKGRLWPFFDRSLRILQSTVKPDSQGLFKKQTVDSQVLEKDPTEKEAYRVVKIKARKQCLDSLGEVF
jgi:hypothetical protein